MRSLVLILLFCHCLLVNSSNNIDGLFYKNQFNDKQENIANIENHLDEVRAQVGRFILYGKRSFLQKQNKSEITFACWIKPIGIEKHSGTILAEDDLFNFRYLSTRQIQFNFYNKKDIDTKPIVSSGLWQHIAFTLNKSGLLHIYYNGDCIKTDSISNNWHKRRNLICLGSDKFQINSKGFIDDIFIYNEVLDSIQIKDLYQHTKINASLHHNLLAYLPLKSNTKNVINSNIKAVRQNISFIKDKERGECAFFPKDSCFIDLEGLKYNEQLTISAWIKPEKTRWLMAIAGNQDLCFRFTTRKTQLWFSVPMLYVSHTHDLNPELSNWSHIAMSVSFNHKVDFYLNGILVDSQNIGGKSGKETVLTIGRSIWDNDFNGKMSQFALWDRALNSDEIRQVYNGKLETLSPDQRNNSFYYLLIGVLGLTVLFFSIYFFINKRKQTQTKNTPNSNEDKTQNSIFITDTFRAFDKDGVEITNQFSPTLIKLLALVILYPIIKNKFITSAELSDILWESDSPSQQKNNRSTNVHRLRRLLENFSGVELIYQNKEWQLNHSNELYIDITRVNKDLSENEFEQLPETITLCRQLRTDNFDTIIISYEQKYISRFQSLCISHYSNKKFTTAITLAKLWCALAPLSEQAHQYHISSLLKCKHKQEAINLYNHFSSVYKKALNESLTFTLDDCNHFAG